MFIWIHKKSGSNYATLIAMNVDVSVDRNVNQAFGAIAPSFRLPGEGKRREVNKRVTIILYFGMIHNID